MCMWCTKKMRTPGQSEDLYRQAQEAGVIFIRCQDPSVRKTQAGRLVVEGIDDLLGEEVSVQDLELVVLATGMVPMTALGKNVKAQDDDKAQAAKDAKDAKDAKEAAKKAKAEAAAKEEADDSAKKKKKKKKKGAPARGRRSGRKGRTAAHSPGHHLQIRRSQPGLPPGPGTPGSEIRFPGFALYLLPL